MSIHPPKTVEEILIKHEGLTKYPASEARRAFSQTKLALKKLVVERMPNKRENGTPKSMQDDYSWGFNQALDQVNSIIEEIFK